MFKRLKTVMDASLVLSGVFISGCSMLQKKIDPFEEYVSDTGFKFQFSMTGEWLPGGAQPGAYMVGQRPTEDGASKLAMVRHGPLHTTGGKPMSPKEMLAIFQRDIENESKGGRVSKVKSTFTQKKYEGADCLVFDQTGIDATAKGPMNMNNDGIVCLHPRKPYKFIWMAISERWPIGRPMSLTFNDDKSRLLNSLKFVD